MKALQHRSYRAQAAHYFFERPHTAIRIEPVAAPAAWRGDRLDPSEWREELDAADREELLEAIAAARATGVPTGALRPEDVPMPRLAARIEAWRRELAEGRGFLLISGIPVEAWSDEEAGVFFWAFGLHLGLPGAQNAEGDLLGHVVDTGEEADSPFVRRYRTAGDIAFHCDAADVVGLLCLRAAQQGGASRIASSVTIYDEILRRRPKLVARLYEPFALDLRGETREGQPGWAPVTPCRHAEGRLRTFYHSDYFRSATRHADVPPFTPEEQELLDLYEEIAATPGIHLDMELAPGDVQLLSNHTAVHARTAYRDDLAGADQDGDDTADPRGGRHLLRLWLSLDGAV